MEPPGVSRNDGRRVFSSVLTGDWFQSAKASVPPGTKPKAFSIFWDDTVKTATGAKYSLLQLYDNHLPLAERFKSENITVFGFVPIVRRPVACLRFANLGKSGQQAWLRADRAAVSNGVLKLILDGFAECGAGICVAASATELEPSPIYVPIPAVWWFDHPQHMAMCGCRQCGYCDVAMRGVAALSDFGAKVELRKSKAVRELIDKLAAARQRAAADPPGNRAKQEAKLEVQRLAKILESERSGVAREWHKKRERRAPPLMVALLVSSHIVGRCSTGCLCPAFTRLPPPFSQGKGLNEVRLLQWSERYTDAYQNVSLSPLHVLKGVYADEVDYQLLTLYNSFDTDAGWRKWLYRTDLIVVRELALFPCVQGRIKSKGLSGALLYKVRCSRVCVNCSGHAFICGPLRPHLPTLLCAVDRSCPPSSPP